MKQATAEIRKALLLHPESLTGNYHLIGFLTIKKELGKTDFNSSPCIKKEVKHHLAQSQPMVQSLVEEFDINGIDLQLAEIKKAVKASGTGEASVHTNMLRLLHGRLEKLKPVAPSLKWYQRLEENGKYKIVPCHFSTYRPVIQFAVEKKDGKLKLQTLVDINGTKYSLDDFQRFGFLLMSRNEYYILSFRDFKTLEWIGEFDFTLVENNFSLFESEILARLQTDYTVDTNHIFSETILSPEPINRIYLNELSGSFLMITPQWKYDEFLIEGAFEEFHRTKVHGKSYAIKRNEEKEKAFLDLMQSFHSNFPNQLHKGYFYISFADAQKKQWFLKAYHKMLELNIELAGLDMLKHFRLSSHKAEASFSVVEQSDQLIRIKASVQFGSEKISLTELQKTLMAGQHAVLLKDGSLGVLGEEWLQKYSTIFKHGKINGDIITVASWMAIHQSTEDEGLSLRKTIPENWWARWKQWQEKNEPVFDLPASVQATLRPYQQKGFEWMMLLSELGAGVCLADDMGLGKTLQTISFLASQIIEPHAKALIVCPASLIYNWQAEINKFAPSLSVTVYHGPARNTDCFTDSTQVIISTYGTVRSDIDRISPIHWLAVVLDESHQIKNPHAQVTQAIHTLIARYRIALSGTPVMNNTFDLYSQLNFAVPGMFGSREFFKKEYADPIDIFGDEEKLKSLNKLTAPFILRRTKEQVATDLPEKTEMIRWCEMGPAQKQQYEEIRDQVKSSLLDNIQKKGLNNSKIYLLQAITRLRQICNSPLLLPEHERTCSDSIKTDILMDELCNKLGGHKAIVFSQFSSMLDLLAAECQKRNLDYYHFDGQTPPAARAKMVDAFQSEDDKTPVFLISLKAGNAGLNLTAADYVFLFDPWWNTAVQQQAINRTHRIGQTKSVFAYQMICKDTIEEKIIAIQQKKQKLSDELIAAEDGFLQQLTEEEVLYLFS